MKKTLLILAVLALAIPAMAETVAITATDLGGGLVEISYEVTGGTNLVRAFALDINVANGNIVDVNNYFVGECNATEQGYGIFLGNIAIDAGGNVTSYGSPVAPGGDPGAQAGLGNPAITIEMGSLYEDGNAPGLSGVLCIVQCDTTVDTTISVAVEEAARGGIVMEDTVIVPTVDLTGATDVPVIVEEEGCTCWGDIAGEFGPDNAVSLADLSALMGYLAPDYAGTTPESYVAPIPEGWECADIAGEFGPDGLLSLADLSAMMGYLAPDYAGTTPESYVAPCMPAP